MSFEALWLEMEAAAVAQSGMLRRRVLPDAACDLFVGIEHPNRRRALLLRVPQIETPALESAPQARGVEMRIGRLPDDPADCTSVVLALADEACRDIFAVLVDDIAAHVGAARPRAPRWNSSFHALDAGRRFSSDSVRTD